MIDPAGLTLKDAASAIRRRKLSSLELTKASSIVSPLSPEPSSLTFTR